jgi:hypothetical protein
MSYFTEYIRRLPLLTDGTYIADVHKELTAEQTWSIPGLKGVAQLSWGLTLRQLSQYQTPAGKYISYWRCKVYSLHQLFCINTLIL